MFGTAEDSVAAPTTSTGRGAGAFGPFDNGNGLSDTEIRKALREVEGSGPLAEFDMIIEEVECWRGYVRADYIGLRSNAMAVIEIKSDRDTLQRFSEQIRVYSAVADRVTLIVGWSLAAHALRAAPPWWDVLLAEREPTSRVRFVRLRDGLQNPGVVAEALVAMLPVDDVRRLANTDSLRPLRGRELRQAVAGTFSSDLLRATVREWLQRLWEHRNALAS